MLYKHKRCHILIHPSYQCIIRVVSDPFTYSSLKSVDSNKEFEKINVIATVRIYIPD